MSREDRSRSIGDKRSATFAKPTSFEMSIGDFVSIERPFGASYAFYGTYVSSTVGEEKCVCR